MMQLKLGACSAEQIAVRVLTRVIGHYPAANMLLVDMGWTGTSAQGKEHGCVGRPRPPSPCYVTMPPCHRAAGATRALKQPSTLVDRYGVSAQGTHARKE